jgi:hypothetical protein
MCYFITHPQITKGPSPKPCKVSNMTLTKFVRCKGETYGVCPWAQANIPCLGTSGRRLFDYIPQSPSSLVSWPQVQAHSFHGLKPKLTRFLASSPSSLLSWPQAPSSLLSWPQAQAHSFHGLFRIV